jgi:hypothetical protein
MNRIFSDRVSEEQTAGRPLASIPIYEMKMHPSPKVLTFQLLEGLELIKERAHVSDR